MSGSIEPDTKRIAPATAHVRHGFSTEGFRDSDVIDMHLSFGAVCQVSSLPDNDGFLIRVWPVNGTHEYGGNNMTILSAVVQYGPDLKATLDHIEWRSDV